MEIAKLKTIAKDIRIEIIKMLEKAGSGHSAGSLDIVEVMVALYFETANINPKNYKSSSRDRVILSAGHLCPAWYAVLAERKFFSKDKLRTLRTLGSPLQGHPLKDSLPGIENASGPLGQGVSMAVGLALASKIAKKPFHVWCISSDGECDEGQVWEAAMCAHKYSLGNLTIIIDRNQIQIDGRTEDIMPLEPFIKKFTSFGFNVEEVSGHSFPELIDALGGAKTSDRPTAIIANTTPGKNVNFMEESFAWHGKAPNTKQAKEAIKDIKNNFNA